MKPDPATPLEAVDWIPRNRLAPLARLGLATLGCLVRHYPRRHEDRRAFSPFPDSETPSPILLHGRVAATALKRFGRRKGVYEATLEDLSGGVLSRPILLRWFNMPYMQNAVLGGQELVVFGRPRSKGRQIVIDHPEYEVLDDEDESSFSHMRRIVPIHAASEGIAVRQLRVLIWRALEETDLDRVPLIPASHPARPSAEDFVHLHFPPDFEALEKARARLVLDECFAVQLVIQARRASWGTARGQRLSVPGKLGSMVRASLPFQLTADQERVLGEILSDMAAPGRMHRLLQGDVGSGKTIVALLAMLACVEGGRPAAIMVPTQILATQHFSNFERLLRGTGVRLALRTGQRRSEDLPLFEDGPAIVVGTHALLHTAAELEGTGLVVIDEQHKFGVLQRSRLVGLAGAPDVLVMTATPIPRTLAQILYGDLDVSILREKPAGRGSVRTVVRPDSKLPEVVAFLRRHLEAGRQAYIVYPLIDESEKLAAKAAAAEFEKWSGLLDPLPVALLHGRTPPEERDRVLAGFRAGHVAALVSTTVIEVGIDVPNASLLLVENAERFGLAQLHQLRGRIGRGSEKSYCVLLHAADAGHEARERLAALERTSDGFAIAEEDFRLRGMGNVIGTAQSGLPPFRIGEFPRDDDAMNRAIAIAREVLADDPGLALPANRRLAALLERDSNRETSF